MYTCVRASELVVAMCFESLIRVLNTRSFTYTFLTHSLTHSHTHTHTHSLSPPPHYLHAQVTYFYTPSVWSTDLVALFSQYTGVVLPSMIQLPMNWLMVGATGITSFSLVAQK
jgi:hypothetical protein